MELKEFIKNSITSISEAILESQTELKEKGVLVNPEKFEVTSKGTKQLTTSGSYRQVQTLKFDVLVGVESENEGKGGSKIAVAQILEIGGSKTKKKINENQSRISFEIPIVYSAVKVPEDFKTNTDPFVI